jgi:hypothetical protein
MRLASIVAAAGIAMSSAHPFGQSQQARTLTGTVTIKTRKATTAVHGKSADPKQGDFMFCIDQDRSAPQAVDFSGPARVVYRPLPGPDVPEGVVITGPENVANTLAVLATDGRAWLFVGKGEKPVLPPGDAALAKATTVNVRGLRRTDWERPRGPRGGTDMEGCLAPGG